jgi:peptidyl-prolyl cis-trans isomerase C
LAARVNGVDITTQEVEDFNMAVSEKRGFKMKLGYATDELVTRELLAQEAVRQGKDKNLPKTELARSVFKAFSVANAFGEIDVRKEYDNIKSASPKKFEYKIRGIVVKSEADARVIISGMDAGKTFSSFVFQSIDENSKKDDGVMGWFELRDIDVAYQIAVESLKPGTYYKKPVITNYGYSVIKLEDMREIGFPEYATVRESLVNRMGEERREKLMKPLRESAKIERFPGYEPVDVIELSNIRK